MFIVSASMNMLALPSVLTVNARLLCYTSLLGSHWLNSRGQDNGEDGRREGCKEGGWGACLYKCIRSILSDGLRDERNGECGGTGLTCMAVLLKKRGGWQWWWAAGWRTGAYSRRGWAGSVWYGVIIKDKENRQRWLTVQSHFCE